MRALRELIAREPDTMRKIAGTLEKHGTRLSRDGALKRTPRGFDGVTDEDVQAWLRLKHFAFMQDIDDAIVTTPELLERVVALGKAAVPFLDFGWRAIDAPREDAPA